MAAEFHWFFMKPVISKVIIITDKQFWCLYLSFHILENPMKMQLLFLEHILCHILTCTFTRDTRDGIYEVHLSSLDETCKYFFAHVKQEYTILVPVYLAEMRALKLEYIRSLQILNILNSQWEQDTILHHCGRSCSGAHQSHHACHKLEKAEWHCLWKIFPDSSRTEQTSWRCKQDGRHHPKYTMTCRWLFGLGKRKT